MTEDIYLEKLTYFKKNEIPEVVLLVTDNPERIKIVIAWTNLDVKRTERLTELGGECENEVWDWLWENTRYSKKEFIEKIGIPFSELGLDIKLKPLIGNRILYPDGTINSFVKRYLREQVIKLFETKPKKANKKTSE